MAEDKTLASELLQELKSNCKKWFIISLVELVIILLIVSSWFVCSYIVPSEDTTTTSEDYSISQDSEGNGNNNGYIKSGEVNDGKANDKSSEDDD